MIIHLIPEPDWRVTPICGSRGAVIHLTHNLYLVSCRRCLAILAKKAGLTETAPREAICDKLQEMGLARLSLRLIPKSELEGHANGWETNV